MKLMHIADLHIGKKVNEFSMIEDQKYILNEILRIAEAEEVEGVIIAGDVYDKSIPPAEAVDVLDDFLTALAKRDISVFMISGNHDSPERLEFGSRIMGKHKIYIAGAYDGEIPKVSLEDNFGKVHIHLMPYLKPIMVNRQLGLKAASFDEAIRFALAESKLNEKERNILVTHQFVTASGLDPDRSDSEVKSLGGLDNVDVSAFDGYDYVALGHIHRPQAMGRQTVRYSGSPLKYSFSEVNHEKSLVILELGQKGDLDFKLVPLTPSRQMKELSCPLDELRSGQTLEAVEADAYVHITLTDEEEIIDAIGKVRDIYPHVMLLDFDNQRRQENCDQSILTGDDLKEKTSLELFRDFYLNQNNIAMSEEEEAIFVRTIDKLEER